MTFSISLTKVLRRVMGLNTFRELYNILLGFGITIVVEILKWECCDNYLLQWQMIAQVSKSQSGYDVGKSQENSIRSLC